MALRASGRLKVRVTTGPSRVTRVSSCVGTARASLSPRDESPHRNMPLRFVGAPGSRRIERMARPAGLILDYGNVVWALAAEFRAPGGGTAFLSNSGPEVMARVREQWPLEARFDAVVISCEVGLSKPDPRIYQLCLDRLGLAAPATLFVDDRADNVEAAARVGAADPPVRGPRRARAVAGPGPLSGRPAYLQARWPRGSPTWAILFWAWRNTSSRNHCGAHLTSRFAGAGA